MLRSQNIKNDLVNYEEIVYITELMNKNMLNSLVMQNDVLLNITGASIGRSAVYKTSKTANVNQHVCIVRPYQTINSSFIQLNLSSANGQRQIESNQAGGGREGLNFKQIGKLSFYYPTFKEQNKVDRFFESLNNTITLHQRKIQILEKIKRCFLQEMLASKEQHHPTLRFSAFEDSWKNYKLKDIILNEFKGKATASMNGTKSIYLDTNYLNGGKVSYVDSTSNIDKDDVIILWDGSQAGTVYHGFKGALGSTLKAFKPMYSGSFLYLQLLKNQNRIYHSYRTPNIPHVIKSFSEEFLIPMGSQNEQNKISSFFKIIEYEIKLKKEKLDTLMKIKEVYLQKMFI